LLAACELMLDKAAGLKGADRDYYEALANSPLLFPPDDLASANLFEYKVLDGAEYEQWAEIFNQVVTGA
jgi:hypothetical protein